MIKKILNLVGRLPEWAVDRGDAFPAWLCDPLRHPDIQRMDSRQIADLPLGDLDHVRCAGARQ